MKGLIAAVLVAATIAGAAATSSAYSASSSAWYWTPGACKSKLQALGVRIGDGRTFNVQKAFCVGLHNHCWLRSGLRRYKVFIAVVRSYDGIVRRFQLTVTGHRTWSGTSARIIQHYMSPTQFVNGYGPAAWTVAAMENQRGCYDLHP
jgi:hypothetical protein